MNGLMNISSGAETPPAMTSREIAELVNARHDSVRRTIERLAEKTVISLPPLVEVKIQRERRTETALEYVFSGEQGKRDSYVVVAQLCPEFTARLVDRWQELEAQQRPDPIVALSDPASLRGLLLSYSEKVLALENANAELTPKADALDRLATADGSFCITDAAKALQMRPKDLTTYLVANAWIYKRPGTGHYLGYSAKVATGLLEHKVTTVLRADGSEKIVEQVRIKAKGLERLAVLIKPVAKAA